MYKVIISVESLSRENESVSGDVSLKGVVNKC